jgi:hypothetical protein
MIMKNRYLLTVITSFLPGLSILLGLFPLASLAYTIEVTPKGTQGEQVTLKVQVLDDQRVPIQGLTKEDFAIQTNRTDKQTSGQKSIKAQVVEFLQPSQTQADPADIVILLDMSASMKHPVSPNKEQVTKLQGAIDATREFLATVRKDNLPFNVAIVPFAYGCDYSYEVNSSIIAKKLLPVNQDNGQLDKTLDELSQVPVCGATNLYDPLKEAVQYLGNAQRVAEIEKKSQSHSLLVKWFTQSSTQFQFSQRRLAVILLSDGFHVYKGKKETEPEPEPEQFESLKETLNPSAKESDQNLTSNLTVTVHTLGYGEPLTTLRDRAYCPDNITDQELEGEDRFSKLRKCKLPEGIDITEFIVDKKRLTEIAQATGGIHLFPDNAQDVAESLKTFLTSLREYEITVTIPDADRGSTHEVILEVNNFERGIDTKSEPIKMTMGNFLYKTLPPPQRFGILFLIMLGGGLGVYSFNNWSQKLKQAAKKFLQPTKGN